jgi:Ca-activated chloride channel family protein
VLDRSGSMRGDKLDHARRGAIEAVRRLGAGDTLTVIAYDHEVSVLHPAGPVDAEAAIAAIRGLKARGNTNIHAGLGTAADQLREYLSEDAFHRVVLLSDGRANNGPTSREAFQTLGRRLAGDGISVSTIGLGTDYNEDLMTALSGAGQGNAYFAGNAEELAGIFQSEIGDVLSVVADEVVISIETAGGVRPLRLIGREGTVDGRRVTVPIRQLYAGQEKYALLEVAFDPREATEAEALAIVDVRYRSKQRDNATLTLTGLARAAFSEDGEAVLTSRDLEVTRAIVFNETADAQDRAIELADAGKTTEAAELVRERLAFNRAAAEAFQDEALDEYNRKLAESVEAIEQDGLSAAERKSLRTNAYQTRNQQSTGTGKAYRRSGLPTSSPAPIGPASCPSAGPVDVGGAHEPDFNRQLPV